MAGEGHLTVRRHAKPPLVVHEELTKEAHTQSTEREYWWILKTEPTWQ